MGIFGRGKKQFISNNKLYQFLFGTTVEVENMLEELFLYRNVESTDFSNGVTLVKFKDLKVRSELEVEAIRKQLRREAGLDFGR